MVIKELEVKTQKQRLPPALTSISRTTLEQLGKEIDQITFQSGLKDLRRIKELVQELQEILNPLMLYPLILRTRCDLCPV
jgi:hypothetical protein